MSNSFSARGWASGRSNHQLLKGIASGSAIYSSCCSRQPSRSFGHLLGSDGWSRTREEDCLGRGAERYGAGRRDHGHRMGNVVHFMSRSDIQAGPLQVVSITAREVGAVFDGMMNVSPTISCSSTASCAARRWSLGTMTTNGSVTTRL